MHLCLWGILFACGDLNPKTYLGLASIGATHVLGLNISGLKYVLVKVVMMNFPSVF